MNVTSLVKSINKRLSELFYAFGSASNEYQNARTAVIAGLTSDSGGFEAEVLIASTNPEAKRPMALSRSAKAIYGFTESYSDELSDIWDTLKQQGTVLQQANKYMPKVVTIDKNGKLKERNALMSKSDFEKVKNSIRSAAVANLIAKVHSINRYDAIDEIQDDAQRIIARAKFAKVKDLKGDVAKGVRDEACEFVDDILLRQGERATEYLTGKLGEDVAEKRIKNSEKSVLGKLWHK